MAGYGFASNPPYELRANLGNGSIIATARDHTSKVKIRLGGELGLGMSGISARLGAPAKVHPASDPAKGPMHSAASDANRSQPILVRVLKPTDRFTDLQPSPHGRCSRAKLLAKPELLAYSYSGCVFRRFKPLGKTPKKDDDELPSGSKLAGQAETPGTDPLDGDASAVGPPPKVEQPLSWMQAIRKGDAEAFKSDLCHKLDEIIVKYKNLNNYEVLFLFDDDSIGTYHSDRLYSSARPLKGQNKDILLIIDSPGGRIEPAYLISKTLKRIASKKFSVAVPRKAKSAATLISLGADEIHMGMISQLGPIDPQVSGLPALALGNALNHIAEIAEKRPAASEMLTKYLIDQAPIRILGYYERVSESAAQYAERLL